MTNRESHNRANRKWNKKNPAKRAAINQRSWAKHRIATNFRRKIHRDAVREIAYRLAARKRGALGDGISIVTAEELRRPTFRFRGVLERWEE